MCSMSTANTLFKVMAHFLCHTSGALIMHRGMDIHTLFTQSSAAVTADPSVYINGQSHCPPPSGSK